MATMVMSDSTEFSAISTDANTGRSTLTKLPRRGDVLGKRAKTRPSTTTVNVGTTSVPMSPSGSRAKILSSSQVSFQRCRSVIVSVSNGMAGDLQKHVLQRRRLGAEVGDVDPMIREAPDHRGHEILTPAADGVAVLAARDRVDGRHRTKVGVSARVFRGQQHG